MDSGGGTAYNAGNLRGGQLFPSKNDGSAVDSFGSLGLTAKARLGDNLLRWGTLQPRMPLLLANDGRLLPQTFQGAEFTSQDFGGLKLTAGKLEHYRNRNSSNNEPLTIPGATSATAPRSNAFYYSGADYSFSKQLTGQYYFGRLEDFYQQHFIGLVHQLHLGPGNLTTDLRYLLSTSTGKNASAEGRAEGYVSNGRTGFDGEVDSRVWSALMTHRLAGHSVGLGYQANAGNSDIPFLTQGDGATLNTITNRLIAGFQHSGERTSLAQYSYDFAALGLPGLNASTAYLHARGVELAGNGREWERDISLAYSVQSAPLQGVNFAWRNGVLRTGLTAQRNQDQKRLIISYTLALF